MKKIIFSRLFSVLLVGVSISACGGGQAVAELPVTAPGISVQITKSGCPSIEIQAGMQISWTNMDSEDRVLLIERVDDQGKVVESGGTDLLQPGSTFSIILTETGEYTYYCSKDKIQGGMITVLPRQ